MKNVLTREKLLKAQKSFSCKYWVNPIQDILDSTNDETINIENKYLDLIKDKATWKQIILCKSLNLDLKWGISQETKEWLLEKIKGCEVIKYDKFRTLYKENGKTLFYLNSKYKEFWFDYDEIEQVLKDKCSLKDNEMRELMNTILEEHFKLEGYYIE